MHSQMLNEVFEQFQMSKNKQSFTHYLAHSINVFEQALEAKNDEIVKAVLEQYDDILNEGMMNAELFERLKNYESAILINTFTNCPLYYRLMGDALYNRFENEISKYYYSLAISHSAEQHDYINLAKAMKNFELNGREDTKVKRKLVISKTVHTLLKMDRNHDEEELFASLFSYVEFALTNKEYSQANQLLTVLAKKDFSKFPLLVSQKNIVTSKMFASQGYHNRAIKLLKEVYQVCMANQNYPSTLFKVVDLLNELGVKIPPEQSIYIVNLLQKINYEKKCMLDALRNNHKDVGIGYSTINYNQEQFIRFSNPNLKNSTIGYTLLLVDCAIKEVVDKSYPKVITVMESSMHLQFIQMLNEKVKEKFGEDVLTATLLNDMLVAYILPMRREEVCTKFDELVKDVKAQYNSEDSILENIFYTTVNNVEHNLSSIEESLHLAYAYIYYEIR